MTPAARFQARLDAKRAPSQPDDPRGALSGEAGCQARAIAAG
jgi:hypothetical protein